MTIPDETNVVQPDPDATPGQPGYRGSDMSDRLAKALADKGEGYDQVPPTDPPKSQ